MLSFKSKTHWLGDAVNVLSMANIAIYIVNLILAHTNKVSWISFSPAYVKDGFCVAGDPNNVLIQSHAICFYEDTITAIIIYFLAGFVGKGRIADCHISYQKRNAIAIFVHGVVHLGNAYRDYSMATASGNAYRDYSMATASAPKQDRTYFQILVMAIGMAIFWLAMINWVMSYSKMSTKIGHAVFWFFFLKYIIPRRYDFAFVHSSLILEFNHSELTHQKSKDEFYNLRTILSVLPTSVVAWMEVFGCENYLRPIGGHAIYDLSIPVCSIVYFAIMLLNQSNIDNKILEA